MDDRCWSRDQYGDRCVKKTRHSARERHENTHGETWIGACLPPYEIRQPEDPR